MIGVKEYTPEELKIQEWVSSKCDKYDYFIAVFCGTAVGLIDVFLVGTPEKSKLGDLSDKTADDLVKKAAQLFWKFDKRSTAEGKSRKMPESLEQCIQYLQDAFPVSYDARYAKDLDAEEGILTGMGPKNHHLLSLSHSPDIIGLLFSIIDQFTGMASFIDQGKIIRVYPRKTSGAIPYLQGTNFISKIFCGFVNWLGHLLSDMVGSSSTRQMGKTGRGAGIPIPFYELLLLFDFSNNDGNSIAKLAINVFEKGYDLRFGAAMAVPVVVNELFIRLLWSMKRKFYYKKEWNECIPSKKHADLRLMLIVSHGTLCLLDGVDATIASAKNGWNPVTLMLHMNIIAWSRFVILVFRELKIRYGPVVREALEAFVVQIYHVVTPSERKAIQEYYDRMQQLDISLSQLLYEFNQMVEKEYLLIHKELEACFLNENNSYEQLQHSVILATNCNVDENRIMKNRSDLDHFFKKF